MLLLCCSSIGVVALELALIFNLGIFIDSGVSGSRFKEQKERFLLRNDAERLGQ